MKFFKSKSPAIFCGLMLSGCVWVGSAKVPKPDVPNQFRSANASYTNTKNLPYLAWWHKLNDSHLNNLIDIGLENNLDIQIALSNLEQAKGQLQQVRLSWIPLFNALTGYSSNPDFGNPGLFYGVFPQYLLNIAMLFKQQQRAKYNVEMVRSMVDGVRLTLIGQIAIGYLTLIAEQEQLRLFTILQDDLKQVIALENDLIKIGLQDKINIAQYIIAEKEVRAQISLVENNITIAQNTLHYLLNQNPGDIQTKNNFASLDFSVFKPGSLPTTVLQNRPDLLIAENNLKASFAGVGAAYGELFPVIKLDSFFGIISRDGKLTMPNHYGNFSDAYLNWGINPSTFGQIDAQKGAYHSSFYQYIQTVRKILKDVDNSFSANVQFSNNYNNNYAAFKTQKTKYDLQVGLYRFGIISNLEKLIDKIDLDTIELLVNQSKLQFSITVVSLYQELAGGYKYTKEVKKSEKNKKK